MRRALRALLFVALAATLGKACQYGAVALFGARLGFAAASLIGLLPFIAALVLLGARYPRHFRYRGTGPGG